mmetsp:Transcript_11699/g.38544  ORF Transcript_11699/g.38544 Transcript_11699/m.38544 type:complete len:167 (-) Transcript_11699:475-975(-)
MHTNCLQVKLTTDDGRSHVMHGAPMPWAEVWRILHGHAAACGRRGTQPPGGVTGARTESNEDEDAPRQCEHVVDVAIINGVTGIDARRAELRTAQRGESRHQLITNLPNRMPKEMLKLHKLYLCGRAAEGAKWRRGRSSLMPFCPWPWNKPSLLPKNGRPSRMGGP